MAKPEIFLLKLEPDYENYNLAPPFGILYLASALEQKGFSVRLYHEKGTAENIKNILEAILDRKPVFVGISTITGPSLLPSLEISKKIKACSSIPVVWGGLHPTMLPQQTLRNESIDIIGMGEGEELIAELAEVIATNGLKPAALERILGIGFRDNGIIRLTPPRPFITDLDRYPPAWDLLPFERYIYGKKYFYSEFGSKLPGDRIGAIITSRGCPWRCGYCYNQFVNKRTFRAHSARRAIADVEYLKKTYGISAVIFEDDDFFANPKRSLEIIGEINLPWSSSIRANYLARWGDEFARELSAHGCTELRIGAESGTPRILELAQKDITREDILRAVELCRKSGIRALLAFMIGFPGESWSEMLETFDLMDNLEQSGDDTVVVNGPAVYFPWPGTALFDRAVELGFRPPQQLREWAVGWGRKNIPAYVPKKAKYAVFYRILALRKNLNALRFPFLARLFQYLARVRWEKRFFGFPIDYYLSHLAIKTIRFLRMNRIVRIIFD